MRALSFILLLFAFACRSHPLAPDFQTTLTRVGGCADVVFFAADAKDETMVIFRADGLVAEARSSGVETTTVLLFPTVSADLRIEQGSRLSDATCDDVIEDGGTDVRKTWHATSGTATTHIRPALEWEGAHGDLLLEDVVFTSDSDERIVLDRVHWVDISVGWYPG